MSESGRAFRELAAMVAAERDARRADVVEIRDHLRAMDRRMEEGDKRTSGFEAAFIDALARMADKQDSIEARVEDLENWRREQAG